MGDMVPCKHGVYTAYNLCQRCFDERLTHRGWWMFCPVLLGALHTDTVRVEPRWFWCAPLYWLAAHVQALVIGLCSMVFEEYEPRWYFKVTGPIQPQP